jgi:hypothetical protein
MSNGIVLPRHRKMLDAAKERIRQSNEDVIITADPSTYLGRMCKQVAQMKPGERWEVDIRDLQEIPSFEHNCTIFTPADRILGNIGGSAYTHSFHVNPMKGTVTFKRHENTGERRYRDPDHGSA